MNARDAAVARALGWRYLGGDKWLSPDGETSKRTAELCFCSSATPETNWLCQQWLSSNHGEVTWKVIHHVHRAIEAREGFELDPVMGFGDWVYYGRLDDLANAIADVLEEQKG